MAVMLSNKHMYVQFIDDEAGKTLAAAGTAGTSGPRNTEAARELGTRAAEAAKKQGIGKVVVDRAGFKFHGRMRAIVEAATTAGLETGMQVAKPKTEKKDKAKDESSAKKPSGEKPKAKKKADAAEQEPSAKKETS
jgi:large subunit ribosomal protein L18